MSSKVQKSSVVPYYIAALTWLLYAVLFPMYRPSHYIFAAAATVIMFLISAQLCRTGARKAAVNAEKAAKEKPVQAADPALEKMIEDGNLAIAEMKRLDLNIEDAKISADIVHLQKTSQKIFDYVQQRPEKLGDIRKFMDYYLPTILKILNSYDRMSAQGISGENIDTTLEQIRRMTGTVASAFDKYLDSLFDDEAMDISADITVLENMMAQEGLTKKQPKTEAPSENEVRLEL